MKEANSQSAIDTASRGRPLVSFLLFAYRQEAYVEAAMRSALAQTYEPLEIIVSDDASPDATFAVIQRIARDYRGPHRLRINRNRKNLGMGAHYDHIMGLAEGEIFVLAAGDDISNPRRTERVVEALDRNPDAGLVYSGMEVIGPAGEHLAAYEHFSSVERINDRNEYIWRDALIIGASFSIRRSLVDKFDRILSANHVEDRTLIFRTYLSGLRIVELPETLVKWRQVGRSRSTRTVYKDADKTRLQNYLMDEKCAWWVLTSFRQHLVDLWSLDEPRPDLERALLARIAEIGLAHELWRVERPAYRMLLEAVRGGARLLPSLKLFLKFRHIRLYLTSIEKWRWLKRRLGMIPAVAQLA